MCIRDSCPIERIIKSCWDLEYNTVAEIHDIIKAMFPAARIPVGISAEEVAARKATCVKLVEQRILEQDNFQGTIPQLDGADNTIRERADSGLGASGAVGVNVPDSSEDYYGSWILNED